MKNYPACKKIELYLLSCKAVPEGILAGTWDFQQCGMCHQQRLRPACTYAQSDQSLCLLLDHSMTVKLLAKQYLEFLSLKGGCTGSTESIYVKMPHCSKSHVAAHLAPLTDSDYSTYSKFSNTFFFLFSHKTLAFKGWKSQNTCQNSKWGRPDKSSSSETVWSFSALFV